MLARLRKVVIWQYPETTSVETLLRHQRRAARLIYTEVGACMLMFSSFVDVPFVSGEVWRWVIIIVLLGSGGLALLLMVPALCAHVWIEDIDRALRARGYETLVAKELDRKVGIAAMKMFFGFWALLFIVKFLAD
ncbi:MAG TPA: hypothetical protein PKK06_07410 [Phycisphaerae bacterium]|nr:hypothetical protein [Phycisphaerae bacterium]HNU45031.1 hypothetical protein [Phycisphaerae bacterium]